jgi:molecular chaperone GrpE
MDQRNERPKADRPQIEGAGPEPTDAGTPSGAPPSEVDDGLTALSPEELRGELRQARRDAQQNWEHFLHSAADLENYKKHAARDRQEAVERTRRQMLALVLNVLDNLERAIAFGDAQEGSAKGMVDGLKMTHRQVLGQLEAIGVRPIEAVGKAFDPRLHEAVSVVPPADAGVENGTVVGEVLRGYLLNDDVLRPARVAVAGAKNAPSPDGSAA